MDVKGPAHLERQQQRFSVGYAIAVITREQYEQMRKDLEP